MRTKVVFGSLSSIFWIMFVLLFLPYNIVNAEVGLSIGSGLGLRYIIPKKFSVQKSFNKHWSQASNLKIGGYWEASFYALKGRRGLPIQNNQLIAWAIAPVFRFEKIEPTVFGYPYLDIGIGLSWLSKKEICGRELGLHFQFEDKIGLGLRFGCQRQFDVSYKFIHFSNAFLGPRNNGIDLHTVILGYWF